jgi:hypothetical protein
MEKLKENLIKSINGHQEGAKSASGELENPHKDLNSEGDAVPTFYSKVA